MMYFSYLVLERSVDQRRVPLSFTPPSVQHINSTQQGHSFLAPKIPQFNTLLSSTPKGVWNWRVFGVELRGVLFRGVFGVELRDFWCRTEEVLVLNWGVFGVKLRGGWNWAVLSVELRNFGVELRGFSCWTEGCWVLEMCGFCVEPMCWTKWVCVELGYSSEKEPPKINSSHRSLAVEVSLWYWR